jgi:altronate dehydratase small subunit
MKIDAIMIKPLDTVATALRDIQAGEKVFVGTDENKIQVKIKEAIQYGHKFAVRDICQGSDILKYGEIIGRSTKDIESGTHAHIQNIESLRGRGDLEG